MSLLVCLAIFRPRPLGQWMSWGWPGPCVSWLSRDWDLVTADKTIVIPSPGWSQRIIINIHTNIINLIVSCYRAQIQWRAQITLRQTLSQPNNKIRESSETIQLRFKLENIKTLLAPPRCSNVRSLSRLAAAVSS